MTDLERYLMRRGPVFEITITDRYLYDYVSDHVQTAAARERG